MIESSFSFSSLWDSDPLQDLCTELPFAEFDDYTRDYTETLERNSSSLGSLTAADLSCSSSDHENGNIFEGLDFLPVADSFISQILEESNSTDNWSCLDNEKHGSSVEKGPSTGRKTTKKVRKRSNLLTSKAWSKMSPEEQLKTLHVLSEIVTCHMGIRDQIEVIKIIDPSVTISPDDKEFALDVSRVNDSKMKRIRDYVQKIGYSLSDSPRNVNNSKHSFTSKPSSSRKLLSAKINSRTKRRQKKQKEGTEGTDEDTRKKRKLELHGLKEVRSGLFVYEKVIKKLSNPLEEDEDVNILE